jgi:GT2 family glycosyltransferase
LITHAGIFGTNDKPALRGWKRPDDGQFDEIRDDALSVSGSAYFIKRLCWDELTNCSKYRKIAPDAVGAFLPTPHYYEETFCSYHAREHGWKVVYDGETSMVHKWHKASPVGGVAEKKHMPESRKMFRAACDMHGITHD